MVGKKDLLFLLVIAVVGVFYFYMKNRVPNLKAVDIRFSDDNKFQTISGLDKENTLVVFFASWCGHCLQELPILIENEAMFEEKNIYLVLVTDDDIEKVEMIRKRYDLPFELLKLDGSIKSFGVNSIPATFFYKNGELVHSFNGVTNWNSTEAQNLLNQYFD